MDRISTFLSKLEAVWRKNPDDQFGALIIRIGKEFTNPFSLFKLINAPLEQWELVLDLLNQEEESNDGLHLS